MRRSLRRRPAVAMLIASALLTSLAAVIAPNAATAVSGPLPLVENFEGSVPITTSSPGIFPFGNDAASTPTLSVVAAPDLPGAAAGNHALDVPYTVSGYGGFSDNLSAPQNWSGYGGFSFWVKGTGSGQRVEYEIKDGGTDGEHSELWQGFFTDSVAGWQHIQVPFADLVKRTDYQPPGGPSDGVLNLTSMWGFAVNLPQASGHLVFDEVTVYGKAKPKVSAPTSSYLADAGQTVPVAVTVTTPDGTALGADVTVAYSLGGGTAVAGTDFTAASGTLTFPAGAASGST
ncbi:MAG: glycosyl hydrolase, partial [Pseudonocardiales bacterium]|nr:glycosyl hydrolase [Pseudonocardiales bacterium]